MFVASRILRLPTTPAKGLRLHSRLVASSSLRSLSSAHDDKTKSRLPSSVNSCTPAFPARPTSDCSSWTARIQSGFLNCWPTALPLSTEELEEIERKRQRKERRVKKGLTLITVGFVSVCLYYGFAGARDVAGRLAKDEYSGAIYAPFYGILKGIKAWRDYFAEPRLDKLLPDPVPIPPGSIQPKYTIVLEIMNVLVAPVYAKANFFSLYNRFFKIRPHLNYFLNAIGNDPNFEVVIYTSHQVDVRYVMKNLDLEKRTRYQLYMDNIKYQNGHRIKDLSRLNRDLGKVILIDVDSNRCLIRENALILPKWEGDSSDSSLIDLAEFLKTIARLGIDDVRPVLINYASFDDPAKEFRTRALNMAVQEKQQNSVIDGNSFVKINCSDFFLN